MDKHVQYNEMILSMFTQELESVIDFPEKAGAVIDCAKHHLFTEVADILIVMLNDHYGSNIYEDYKNGLFEYAPEYKSRPMQIDGIMGEIRMLREEQEIKERGLIDDTQSGNDLERYALVSDCCGADSMGGEDYFICPECREHCGWVKMEAASTLSHDSEVSNIKATEEEAIAATVATSPLNYSAKRAIEEKLDEQKTKQANTFKDAIAFGKQSIERLKTGS